MKRLIAIVVSAGVCGGLIVACSVKKPSDSSDVAQILRQIELNWEDAVQARDVDRVGQIEADDWRSVGHNGKVETKEDDLNSLRSGKGGHVEAELGPIDVKMLGDDVAVVQSTLTDKSAAAAGTGNEGGRPAYAYMDVWVKRGGKWMVVRSQTAKVN
jgi:ketosteroid isomerase-like protein